MTRGSSKDVDLPSVPGRRSLRNRQPEEESKKGVSPKGKKLVGKKKANDLPSKTENKVQELSLSTSAEDKNGELSKDGAHNSNGESSNQKLSPKNVRGGRKRPAQEAETEDSNTTEDKDTEEGSLAEASEKKKGMKKKRKAPVKKKKDIVEDESEMWTPLEPLDGDDKRDSQKRIQTTSDRRKQALVERQAAAEVMLQKPLRRRRTNSNNSECQVVHSVSRGYTPSKTIETVDIDDEVSETGSIQIVAEPDVGTVFDFKRLLIQYRSVNLPSLLWGVHRDPRDQFVSFTRFNPDYNDDNDVVVDRVVVFKGTLHPEVFINNKKIELPDMFNVVETLVEAAQVIQFANNTVTPVDPKQILQETK